MAHAALGPARSRTASRAAHVPATLPKPDPAFRYCAFLSYSHADDKVARWLHESIERFEVPAALVGTRTAQGVVPRRLTPLFRDRGELAASNDLGEGIRSALAASRALIVLCSPTSARSRWADAEIDQFKRLRPDGCILAAIVDGEPFASDLPGREAEECFPPALKVHYDRAGRPTRRRAEPTAADLRDHGDGRRMGLLKIIAGLIGVGLDDLVQREAHRRQRRLRMITAASLAGMVLTSGLAGIAIQSRDAARDQRRQAEGLVGFMLGDLRDKLEPIGRLDALDAVGERALSYYRGQDKSVLSDDSLAQRSRALTLMGEIAQKRGDLDGALSRYREAYAGTAEALRRAPDDPQRLFDHAQNVFWVGSIAWQRGQAAEALTAFRDYKTLTERLVTMPGIKPEWRLEPIYADTNLGTLLIDQQRFAEAGAIFQGELPAVEALVASDPGNDAFRTQLVEALAYLSSARENEGRLDEALAQRERQLSLLAEQLHAAPSDSSIKRRLMASERALGRLFASRGDLHQGLAHLSHAASLSEELQRIEPANTEWAATGAAVRLELGQLQRLSNDADAAGQSARAGCEMVERLRQRDRSVRKWNLVLRDSCLDLSARLALDRGAPEEAAGEASQLIANARIDLKRTGSAEARMALASGQLLVGDVAARLGRADAARSAWSAALAAIPERPPPAVHDLARRALLLERLGRAAEAAPIRARLKAAGYRHPAYAGSRARP